MWYNGMLLPCSQHLVPLAISASYDADLLECTKAEYYDTILGASECAAEL